MSYVINIKSHIKQGFTLSLENTASEKPRSGAGGGGRGEGGGRERVQIDPPPFLIRTLKTTEATWKMSQL